MIRVVGPNPAMDRTQVLTSVVLNQVNRSTVTKVHAGGKGLDVARTIKKLGHEVAIYGFLGGMVGEYLRQSCNYLGIVDRHITIDSETRICNIMVEEENGRVTVINEKGPNINEPEAPEGLINSLIEDCQPNDIVILSGSLPGNLTSAFYAEIIERLRPSDVKIIVDASGDVLRKSIDCVPWMVKLNIKELEEINGTRLSTDDIPSILNSMQVLVNKGISVVSITLGEQGALTVTKEERFLTTVPRVSVINPTASGDTFIGAFAVKYMDTHDVMKAIHFGATCSVANVMNLAPELRDDIDLDELAEKIMIHPLGSATR